MGLISQPIGRLVMRCGIATFGSTGESLAKGVVMPLFAIGLSIKPGGSAREIDISVDQAAALTKGGGSGLDRRVYSGWVPYF
jgi:hypothetical protein